jgi:hypothetical protein
MISPFQRLATSLGYMPSDMINKPKKRMQDRSILHANLRVLTRDKVKTVLALINELQLQDSTGSDEVVDISASSNTAMICKLAQVPPEIWMTLSMEAKKWM